MNTINNEYKVLILFCLLLKTCWSSNGDRTGFFNQCCQNCERQNCTADGIEFQEQAIKYYKQSVFDKLLKWSCIEECQYGCMWRTVEAFRDRDWPVPQFYGKWPFIRFMGLQEPASVLFSIFNLCAHYRGIKRFRKEVRRTSPCYHLWHFFAYVCLNGWTWSTVFHAKDTSLTELLDYAFAYSMVLVTLYCMVIRMLIRKSIILRGVISLIFLSYYINYFAYLSVGKLNYQFNMIANIITGLLSALGWLIWSFKERHYSPHYRKIVVFYITLGLSMSLEVLDFPPFLWILDAHSLWHLSTSIIATLIYSFAIDDCKLLHKQQQQKQQHQQRQQQQQQLSYKTFRNYDKDI